MDETKKLTLDEIKAGIESDEIVVGDTIEVIPTVLDGGDTAGQSKEA